MNEIKPELWVGDMAFSGTGNVRIQVGTLRLCVHEVLKFGQKVDVSDDSDDSERTLVPAKQWPTMGFLKKGWLMKIDEERPADDILQAVRDLAVRFRFEPMPGSNLRVAAGNDKLFATDDKGSWELRHSELGVSCWYSNVGNRAAWPERTVSLTPYGRVLTPAHWVMDLVSKHVDRLVDPYAWKDKTVIRLGGRRDE